LSSQLGKEWHPWFTRTFVVDSNGHWKFQKLFLNRRSILAAMGSIEIGSCTSAGVVTSLPLSGFGLQNHFLNSYSLAGSTLTQRRDSLSRQTVCMGILNSRLPIGASFAELFLGHYDRLTWRHPIG
jgi:hypothetical protein